MLLKAIENALNEDQSLLTEYSDDSRSVWLLFMPKFVADLTWTEQLRQRVAQRAELLRILRVE